MKRTARSAILLFSLVFAASIFSPLLAQAPEGPLPPKPGVAPEKVPPEQQGKLGSPIRVRVNVVSLPVTVRNNKDELVLDLEPKDFQIFDNGIAQKIEHFDIGGDPLSIVFLVETSAHIEPLLPAIRKSGIVFTQAVMGETADAAVMTFSDSTTLLLPFTSDHDKIQHAINALPLGGDGIKLYDSMVEAVRVLDKQPANRRRVILIVSEAADQGSETGLGEALRVAQLDNVAIYTIGLSSTAADFRAKPSDSGPAQIGPPGTLPLPSVPGRPDLPSTQAQEYGGGGNINLLELAVLAVRSLYNVKMAHALAVASAATGGAYQSTMRDRSIEKTMDMIGGELHAQYLLGYRPQGEEPSGYHEIKVTVSRANVKVRTRPGYWLPPPPAN